MYENELELAKQAAIEAGNYLKDNYDPQIDSNIGKDIKLSSDKKSETIIVDILRQSGHAILSEECGWVDGSKELSWIIDPLDGTANYWRGMKELACVSVALWKGNEPIIGVINRFEVEELYYGQVGKGAFLNGKPIRTSEIDKIKDAFIATGFPVKADYSEDNLRNMISNAQRFKKVRMFGTAAIMGASVAAGRIDAYIEDGIMIWDIAASTAIVKAAGGITDIKMLNKDQCVCKLFANNNLYENYLSK